MNAEAAHNRSPEKVDAARSAEGGVDARARHVAIIMDGNGRWAKKRRLPRVAGHKVGVESVRKVVEAAPKLGIDVLTLYAFSSENWKRPETEVSYLMGLLKQYVLSEIAELDRNDVRLSFIGDYRKLPADVLTLLDGAAEKTRSNRGLRLVIALSYGSQDEILRAARALAAKVKAGEIEAEDISEEHVEDVLDTADLPPLDLMIRTSGEQRLSNFLLWQSAYAELVFTDTYWPDFDGDALAEALDTFKQRDRRYGGL